MTTPAPTPTPTPIPIVLECDPLVVLSFGAVDVEVSDVVADDLVCVDADAVVAVVVGAIPAVAVISGSGKVNRSTLESLQQSSAEQQYEVEFLPQRITHSPPVTLSLGANHVSAPDSTKPLTVLAHDRLTSHTVPWTLIRRPSLIRARPPNEL